MIDTTFELKAGLVSLDSDKFCGGVPKPDKQILLKQKQVIMNRINNIEHYADAYGDLNMILTPEHTFYYGEAIPLAEFESIISDFTEHVEGSDLLLVLGSFIVDDGKYMYNRVPIIAGKGELYNSKSRGRVLHYDKKAATTNGEYICSLREGKNFLPGQEDNVFTWTVEGRKVTYGIEVCADHTRGYLCHFIENSKATQPDVHILLSNGVSFKDNETLDVRNNGYGLCTDGSPYDGGVQAMVKSYCGTLKMDLIELEDEFCPETRLYSCTLKLDTTV